MIKVRETAGDTKARILDAAEHLFAREGYRGTSLRAITGRANVNLAAVNYHFGSKLSLLEEVIKRRLLPLNAIRRRRLEEVRARAGRRGKHPHIKEVLLAFIEPTILFKESSPEAEHFITFIGSAITDPDDTVRNVFQHHIMPLFQLLLETACDALPGLPRDIVYWRLNFTIGSLFHTLHVCGKFDTEAMQMETNLDAQSVTNLIVPYVTAGMKAK